MTKQEQIEEMAVIGCVRNPQAHTAEECAKCDFKQGQCNAYRHAEALYNAGYRTEATLTCDFIKMAQTHAVQEFAEKLKSKTGTSFDYFMGFQKIVLAEQIDELLEEYEK